MLTAEALGSVGAEGEPAGTESEPLDVSAVSVPGTEFVILRETRGQHWLDRNSANGGRRGGSPVGERGTPRGVFLTSRYPAGACSRT